MIADLKSASKICLESIELWYATENRKNFVDQCIYSIFTVQECEKNSLNLTSETDVLK